MAGDERARPRQAPPPAPDREGPARTSRLLKNLLFPRLVKKVQMQGGVPGTHPPGWVQARGVLGSYIAAPRELANAADGPFSSAC